MTHAACWKKAVLTLALAAAMMGFAAQARAVDLPLAAASPLTGVAFDDRPLLLPVQRNFQMAMLTAGSELGRSCGKMEAYGWRMSQTEQARVNQIFNNTVDRLRLLGYTIVPQTLTSVSKDITLFTADHAKKHFMFLWSAGELGLVLNLCETSAPVPGEGAGRAAATLSPSVQVFPVPLDDIVHTRLDTPSKAGNGGFSPVGEWVGGYTCAQGYTGSSLKIEHMRGDNFEGVFSFYPTSKNPAVPEGSYTVYGQYDKETKRILINPGKWINHPHGFFNTVIVGSFDSSRDTFSAYFQGISGCTSLEAHRDGFSSAPSDRITHKALKSVSKKAKAPVKKKHHRAIKPAPLSALDMPLTGPVAVDDKKDVAGGIVLSSPTAPVAPVAAAPVAAPAPALQAPVPALQDTPAPAAKK